jgi:cation:H+ antiporter
VHLLSEPNLAVALVEVVVGIVLLGRAADEFVEGAANTAGALRVSPVLVGAVIVGFGTSLPEMLVSGLAASHGDLELGLGNVVGSNVANLSLVLGAAAMIVPLYVDRSVLSREAPLSLLGVLLFAYTTTGGLSRWEGVLLLAALVASMTWIVVGGRRVEVSYRLPSELTVAGQLGRTVIGLIGTVLAAQLLVWGAEAVAIRFGIGGGFVGFTLVAVGTSLPELVTAVVAARKNEVDLIIGNLLGSNLFNSLAVGGAIAVLGPGPIEDKGLRTVGVVVMVVVAVAAWVAMVTLRRVHRLEAVGLLVAWVVAVAALAFMAGESDETSAVAEQPVVVAEAGQGRNRWTEPGAAPALRATLSCPSGAVVLG